MRPTLRDITLKFGHVKSLVIAQLRQHQQISQDFLEPTQIPISSQVASLACSYGKELLKEEKDICSASSVPLDFLEMPSFIAPRIYVGSVKTAEDKEILRSLGF